MIRVFRSATLLLPLLMIPLLVVAGCAGKKKTDYKVLRYSSFTYPYPEPLKLYIAPDRDRSGSDYINRTDTWELPRFKERLTEGLRSRRLRIDSYTSAGNPATVKLRNPYVVVADSNEADLLLTIRIDAFEEATVDVTTDRIMMWSSYGVLTQYYMGYQRVPRMLVAIDAQLRERGQNQTFYAFQAKGIAVNRPTRREGFHVAMDRAEMRLYERFLRQ